MKRPTKCRTAAREMADQDEVRRIALSLPRVTEAEGHFAFSVADKGKAKGFVWAWMERVPPKKPRVPREDVVAVRVIDAADKRALPAGYPEWCFTEPHCNGFPPCWCGWPRCRWIGWRS
jgi:hypothetical protein